MSGQWREEERRDGKVSLPKEKVGRSGSLSREEVGLSEKREFKVRSRVEVLHVILASSRQALTRIKGNEVISRQSPMLSKTNVLRGAETLKVNTFRGRVLYRLGENVDN